MRIVFFGTPDFAVTSLDRLFQSGVKIIAVVTVPDKASGRGLKLIPSAVKTYALKRGLKVLQPEDLSNEGFLGELDSLKADIFVVVAFRKLPSMVWQMPVKGTINLHASLLPDYRGAAPLNRVIMNGENETGVTTILINDRIDEGDVFLQEKIPLNDEISAGELHDLLADKGADLLIETIRKIADNQIQPIPQPFKNTDKKAPKIKKEDCRIHWNANCKKIYNQVRGLHPYPGAYTYMDNKILKINTCTYALESHNFEAGTLFTDHKSWIRIASKDGFVELTRIQLEGKKAMSVSDFLNGSSIEQIKLLH